jgi:hypothetical protein
MSTPDIVQPMDDQTLYQLLNSILTYEKKTDDDYLKFLEGQTLAAASPWDHQKAVDTLNAYKRQLQDEEDRDKHNLALLPKIAADPRLRQYFTRQLSEKDWQGRLKVVRLLAGLETDWAVVMLRQIAVSDPFHYEKSTAPDHYSDPDARASFAETSFWPVREKAHEALKQLGKL